MCPCNLDNGEFVYALLAAVAVLAGVGLMGKHWAKMGPGFRSGGILGLIASVGLLGYAITRSSSPPATVATWRPDPTHPSATCPGGATEPVSAPGPDSQGGAERVPEPSHTRDASASQPAVTPERLTTAPGRRSNVIAYYFHRTMRCYSCRTIEELSKEVIEQSFSGELSSGLLEFRAVNTDASENRHFEDDYKLSVQSLVLVHVLNGEVTEWKNLEKVWDLFEDYGAFAKYVQGEVSKYLYPDDSAVGPSVTGH